MKRSFERGPDQLRPLRITRDHLKFAMGSCLLEIGDTRVLCAASISDGVPAHQKGKGKGWVTAEYSMLPAATPERGRREATAISVKGRTHEIQRLIGRAMRGVVDMSAMGGEFTMNIDCDVIQADGGTRTAAITGAWLAARDAFKRWQEAGRIRSVPLIDQIAAVSVGVVDGVPVLDLDYSEDSNAEVDMNVVMDARGRFIELQGTAERAPFDDKRLAELLGLAAAGIGELIAVQTLVIEEDMREYPGS
jgi:ribonuclease PH